MFKIRIRYQQIDKQRKNSEIDIFEAVCFGSTYYFIVRTKTVEDDGSYYDLFLYSIITTMNTRTAENPTATFLFTL
jgi:hypothetical protein